MEPGDAAMRIARVERRLRITQCYAAFLTASALVVALSARSRGRAEGAKDGVIRTRGLVIVDEKGRERILIGAPVPAAKNRVRTDNARVKETWGKRFPAKYLDYYKDYRHATNGILILDESGYDRIAMGDPVPDPNIGKRIGPSTGLVINDEQGFERTGYGLLDVNGTKRIVLGLDSAKGAEGLSLFLHDDGPTGVIIGDGKQSAFLGSAPAKHWITGLPEPFLGLLVKGPGGEARSYGATK